MLVHEPSWATQILKGDNELLDYRDFSPDMIHAMQRCSYLYIVGSDDDPNVIKIGYAHDRTYRLSTLQTGNPRKLKFCSSFGPFFHKEVRNIEQTVHQELSDFRLCGEWFNVSVKEAEAVIGKVVKAEPNLFRRIYNVTGIDIVKKYEKVALEQSKREVIEYDDDSKDF